MIESIDSVYRKMAQLLACSILAFAAASILIEDWAQPVVNPVFMLLGLLLPLTIGCLLCFVTWVPRNCFALLLDGNGRIKGGLRPPGLVWLGLLRAAFIFKTKNLCPEVRFACRVPGSPAASFTVKLRVSLIVQKVPELYRTLGEDFFEKSLHTMLEPVFDELKNYFAWEYLTDWTKFTAELKKRAAVTLAERHIVLHELDVDVTPISNANVPTKYEFIVNGKQK